MGLIPSPSGWIEDLSKGGYLRDGLAYGVGALLVLVGLAMVAFGPAQTVVATAAGVAGFTPAAAGRRIGGIPAARRKAAEARERRQTDD